MKRYGIYLAYPPTIDLRAQGLGKHLSEFLKGAKERGDVEFVIACPSWMRQNLERLFDDALLAKGSFEIIAPTKKPSLLSLYEFICRIKRTNKKKPSFTRLLKFFSLMANRTYISLIQQFVGARNLFVMAILALPVLLMLIVAAFFKVIIGTVFNLWINRQKVLKGIQKSAPFINKLLKKLSMISNQPKDSSIATMLYRLMEESEVSIMHKLIHAREDILAWYSPAAFWPHFNQINAPRLMCVPDVVLSTFPVGFSKLGGQRFLDNFYQVEKAILTAQYLVTYSEDIKWRTLIERYHIDPQRISVVRHGTNKLDSLVVVKGFPDNQAATDVLCRNLFGQALHKSVRLNPHSIFESSEVKFLFYASQFRPNKNIISLLRAYEYLLKRRYIGHKLILTGDPYVLPEIVVFIKERGLENDVLCLKDLTGQELAGCYQAADLVVNPTLSEGGCPFTFTEALSVGTPVVMSRIPVTEEVITDNELQDQMLFDPYDWKDMAAKIEWALKNSDTLLAQQKALYDQLSQRSWRHVVDEYVEILDRISTE